MLFSPDIISLHGELIKAADIGQGGDSNSLWRRLSIPSKHVIILAARSAGKHQATMVGVLRVIP